MCCCSKRRCDYSTGKQCFSMGNASSEGWGRDFGAGLLAHARISGHPSAYPLRQLLGALLPSLPGGCYLSLKSLMCHKDRNKASSTSTTINPGPSGAGASTVVRGQPFTAPCPAHRGLFAPNAQVKAFFPAIR